MDELRCRFFGVVLGDEGVVAVAGGGDGLIGGESNGSGGWVPFSLVSKWSSVVVAWIFGVAWMEV